MDFGLIKVSFILIQLIKQFYTYIFKRKRQWILFGIVLSFVYNEYKTIENNTEINVAN